MPLSEPNSMCAIAAPSGYSRGNHVQQAINMERQTDSKIGRNSKCDSKTEANTIDISRKYTSLEQNRRGERYKECLRLLGGHFIECKESPQKAFVDPKYLKIF